MTKEEKEPTPQMPSPGVVVEPSLPPEPAPESKKPVKEGPKYDGGPIPRVKK